jgi:hypothetical protein
MAFVLLKDEDGDDFLCNTSNIASIEPAESGCIINVHKGTRVREWADQGKSRLQSYFRLSAGKNSLRDAIDLADEIALAERDAKTLDLRPRCPPPLKKEPYNPGRGW